METPIIPDDAPDSTPSQRTMPGRKTPRGERLRAGDVLQGRYTVLSELGEGGMGVVYKCLDSVGGIEVALKCLPPELSRNEAEMEGIRENYAIVAKLHHSAISGLRQLEKDPDFDEYYLVMDLAEGEDLSQVLRRRRGAPLPLAEALAILRPLASALDYAHGEKVLHRDVKPANVKVRPAAPGGAPRVQLLDFGLAAEVRSSLSRVSRKGYLGSSGTPSYMAPEQWEARPQGPATDQYALAVVAYQMLAGVRPFDADDPDVLRRAVLSRDPDPIPGLSRGMNAALRRALAKDPATRFPSCTAFVDALRTGRDSSKKRPHSLALIAAVLLAVAAGALWFARSRGGAELPGGPPSSAADVSHAESAVSAESSGGASSPSEPPSPLSPPSPPVPVLPPEGASLAELEDARAILEAKRDALAGDGYAATDPERTPVEEALATLESRIEAAVAERARQAREAELAGRRAAAQRAVDLQALQDLKRAVARRVEGLDATWNDGEFAKRCTAIADAQKRLEECTDAASLAKAKELRGDIYDAADWIERNTPARAGLEETAKAIDQLAKDCNAAGAGTFASASLRKAERARKEADAKRDAGRFEDAAAGLAEAKTFYEKALAEARAAQAAVEVESAKTYKDGKLWEQCLAAADKALEWDSGNADAKALKKTAEDELKKIDDAKAEVGRKAVAPSPGEVLPVTVAGVSFNLCWCPPGSFTMGSNASDCERPTIRVTIPTGFWMGETEVTQELWQKVMGHGIKPYNDKGGIYPMETISWNDCREFVEKLNESAEVKSQGLRFAIPTEAQWEYACRAGTTGDYGGTGRLDDMGWYWANSGNATHPVKGKKPNAWGLYDMHGNVWEWCANAWQGHSDGTLDNDAAVRAAGADRALRGGSLGDARSCRSAFKGGHRPGTRGGYFGLRLVAFQDGDCVEDVASFTGEVKSPLAANGSPGLLVSTETSVVDNVTLITTTINLTDGRAAAGGASSPSEPQGSASSTARSENAQSHAAGERFVVTVASVSVPLRWCPPGSFTMGSPSTEEGRYNDETQHRVTFMQGFWLGETEVTQGLWKKVMGDNPSYFKSGDDYPVENISWNDCQEFMTKLNAQAPVAGFKWALPTEAQWEYACRADTTTAYSWGNALNGDKANCNGNDPCGTTAKGLYKQNTTRVGSYSANPWGFFDMHGNVWEWCADWYGSYPTGSVTDPKGPSAGSIRVYRGGSWYRSARICRSASRVGLDPDFLFSDLGFRVALVPVQ